MSDISASIANLEMQLSALKREAVTSVVTGGIPEPGYTTTEFWGMVVSQIVAVAAIFHPGFTPPPGLAQAFAGGASGIATLGYALGRSLRKKGS